MSSAPATPNALSAVAAARAIASGALSARTLIVACLARIAAREPAVTAWQCLDPAHALAQADACDARQRSGQPLGPLHGVPVGLKDIIDTADMPTENGSVLFAGRRPERDATVVARLRAAGAVILGKTVTTELAAVQPGKTRHPRDAARTPGGSSSGSAAAVADQMCPLALGTQTNGSVIRPASYCGVVGFKPTHGLISRAGILMQSRSLDQVGLFARDVADVALLADVLAGYDPQDPDTRLAAAPRLLEAACTAPAHPARFAFVRSPVWNSADEPTRDGFVRLVAALGDSITERDLPATFAQAHATLQTIMTAEQAVHYGPLWERGRDRISPPLRALIERGQAVTAVEWHRAVATAADLRQALAGWFDTCDAIVTPAATGEAPTGLQSTGSPVFCTIWSLLGMPAISLPLLSGPDGLPIGVQLVARWGEDARLLRTAAWLCQDVGARRSPNHADRSP
jgi:Asp-tRNA(Asn)/Glu-tRNA(Gln) amidotransferase A subunit family amidase